MNIRRVFVFALLLSFTFGNVSCRKWQIKRKRKRDAREIARNKKEKEDKAQAKYQEQVRRHADIQSPKTRRRMKNQYRKADRYNNHRKEFFLKRWFRKIGGKKKKSNPSTE